MQVFRAAVPALVIAMTAASGADLVVELEASYVDKGAVGSHTLPVSGCDSQIHYLEAGPKGFRVLAVDLPGYGQSGSDRDARQRKDFVANFLHALPSTPRRVLLVAASMGGTFGAPFVRGHPTKVAGYVPIAALGVQAGDPVSAVPTLVLWGSLDAPESERAHAHAKARLRFCAALRPNAFLNSQKVVFADAPHPCYLKAPRYFNSLLLQFAGASGSGSVEEGAPAKGEVRVAAQWKSTEAAAEL